MVRAIRKRNAREPRYRSPAGPREASRGWPEARGPVGLDEHVHLYEEHGRTVDRADAWSDVCDRSARDRRIVAAVSISGMERGFYNIGAASTHGWRRREGMARSKGRAARN